MDKLPHKRGVAFKLGLPILFIALLYIMLFFNRFSVKYKWEII